MLDERTKTSPQLTKVVRVRTNSNNTIPMADVLQHFDFIPSINASTMKTINNNSPPTTPTTAQARLMREKKDKRFFDSADYFLALQGLHANDTN